MIRLGILFILLFPITLFAQDFEVIKATSFRAEGNSKSSVIRRVQSGDKGEVLSAEKWWTQVLFRGKVGYIKSANIKVFNIQKTSAINPAAFTAPKIIRL